MKIALFIPCYINALYPQVGEASYRLLRSLGLDVDYPLEQTCCGQPMANAGYERDAQPLAERMEELFAGYDYVVGPHAYGRRIYHGGRQFVSDAHAGRHRPRTAADKDPAYR